MPSEFHSGVVTRKSRGTKVLEEILGVGHKGANIADGWKAYSRMRLQRCWAHLLREVDQFIDASENGKRLSIDIHSCFKTLRDFLDRDHSIEEKIEKKAVLEK
ncbi:MAG: transposase [Candidatus Methanoperedens sp.]|nr:transposase [Candidatus Methanoperedens sp.]